MAWWFMRNKLLSNLDLFDMLGMYSFSLHMYIGIYVHIYMIYPSEYILIDIWIYIHLIKYKYIGLYRYIFVFQYIYIYLSNMIIRSGLYLVLKVPFARDCVWATSLQLLWFDTPFSSQFISLQAEKSILILQIDRTLNTEENSF